MDEYILRGALLMALTFGSGVLDAICYTVLDHVFTAFMTGNLVFLGLSIAGNPGPALPTVAIPIGTFAVGVFCSALIVSPTRGSGVWPRRVTVALAVSLIARGCFVWIWLAVHGYPSGATTGALLGVAALAMGFQTEAVFSLGIEGVFTTAATATLAVLWDHAARWMATRPQRLLLTGTLISLVAGAVCGGALVAYARSYAALVPLAASLLVVVTAAAGFGKDGSGRCTAKQPS